VGCNAVAQFFELPINNRLRLSIGQLIIGLRLPTESEGCPFAWLATKVYVEGAAVRDGLMIDP